MRCSCIPNPSTGRNRRLEMANGCIIVGHPVGLRSYRHPNLGWYTLSLLFLFPLIAVCHIRLCLSSHCRAHYAAVCHQKGNGSSQNIIRPQSSLINVVEYPRMVTHKQNPSSTPNMVTRVMCSGTSMRHLWVIAKRACFDPIGTQQTTYA